MYYEQRAKKSGSVEMVIHLHCLIILQCELQSIHKHRYQGQQAGGVWQIHERNGLPSFQKEMGLGA